MCVAASFAFAASAAANFSFAALLSSSSRCSLASSSSMCFAAQDADRVSAESVCAARRKRRTSTDVSRASGPLFNGGATICSSRFSVPSSSSSPAHQSNQPTLHCSVLLGAGATQPDESFSSIAFKRYFDFLPGACCRASASMRASSTLKSVPVSVTKSAIALTTVSLCLHTFTRC